MLIFWQSSSQVLTLTGLFSTQYENDATVTASMLDANGNAIASFQNVAGVYVPDSDGNYTFQVPSGFNPSEGGGYTLVVKATTTGGLTRTWQIPCLVTGG